MKNYRDNPVHNPNLPIIPQTKNPATGRGSGALADHHSVLYVLHPIERFHDLFLKWV